MAQLRDIHETLEDIPEAFQELYTEKNGAWELTGISGVKTAADVNRVHASLAKERESHKATKEKLGAWGELDHDDVVSKLDKLPELEAASAGKLDEAAIEEIVQKRVDGTLKSKMSPLERDNKRLKGLAEELTKENLDFKAADSRRVIHDSMRGAIKEAKVLPEAEDDVLMYSGLFEITEENKVVTRDGVGVAPGLDATSWLAELQEKKPHWWPGSHGGGAKGSGSGMGGFSGKNPWGGGADEWDMTMQGQYYLNHGPEKAARMAAAAGTTIGGPRPRPKVNK